MFPQTLPYTDIRDIPDEEFNWIITQSLIDDKLVACSKCNHIQSQGSFCVNCGSALTDDVYDPESYVCGECNRGHLPEDHYCRFCGANVGSDAYTKFQKELEERSKTEDLEVVGKDIAMSLLSMCEKVPESWMNKLNQSYEELICDVYKIMNTSEEIKAQMRLEMDKVRTQAESGA